MITRLVVKLMFAIARMSKKASLIYIISLSVLFLLSTVVFIYALILVDPEGVVPPYAGGMFYLEINFSEDYPNRAPEIHFITPIYHPNVNIHKSGSCSPPLGSISYTTFNCWNPSTSIIKALTDLYAIFYWANPDCCFSPKMGNEYKFNRPLYEKKVEYFTKKYAIPFGEKKL